MLSRLTLDCPALESLDATFCYRLGNEALSWIPQCRPPLQRLFLGLCTQIDAQALHVLSSLGSLRSLDLSYTEIKVPLMPTPHLRPPTCPGWSCAFPVLTCHGLSVRQQAACIHLACTGTLLVAVVLGQTGLVLENSRNSQEASGSVHCLWRSKCGQMPCVMSQLGLQARVSAEQCLSLEVIPDPASTIDLNL